MVPDEYLSLDDTIYPTRVDVAFCQYNKNKPAKCGFLFRSINTIHVTLLFFILAKPTEDPNEYYITTKDDLVKCLVTNLTYQVNMQGCNMSCDRFYTSSELANWFLERKMKIVGTIKTNRKDVSDLKKIDGRENNSTLTYWEKDKGTMIMTSYVGTPSLLVNKTCLY